MAITSTDIPQLVFNKMSSAKYNELKEAGQLVDNEFYITPDITNIPDIDESTNDKILSNNGSNLIWKDEQVGYNQITNCITEIPQDIKLELNSDGSITLKAGSKVYDGAVNVINVNSDKTLSVGLNIQSFVFYNYGTRNLVTYSTARCFSGGSQPSGIPSGTNIWFDTANKVMKLTNNGGSSWSEYSVTLPLGLITSDTSQITSIDQVFNGFGYIGSTIFALPGVEGLIPNGRNTDGSLNNIKYTISNLLTVQAGITSNGYFGVANGSLTRRYSSNSVYDEYKNIWYNPETGNNFQFLYCGNFSEVSSRITSFNPKMTFNAVDRNDTEWVSTQSMPINRYIDLTWGATGTSYIAPANGWFTCQNVAGTANTGVRFSNVTVGSMGASCISATIEGTCAVTVPAKKGDQVILYYTTTGTALKILRFIYAEGENQ